ncbi:apolipoprotein N-acyltransferase [[Limnothrix rosea] IAM M-220]|uniref:apolipoprotein N-acyltransferase n=1 Tax=[Limnothrix rosea] IAM M-220 TaxID=454133 RepID=UPI001CEC2767|nr:apolipoprotein N-acyltransferase [[Limnothrix rosea] IAM M-220]
MMRKILFAFGSGIGMGLTSAPLEAWYLAWVAVIPLWLIIITPNHRSSQEKIVFTSYSSLGKVPEAEGVSRDYEPHRKLTLWKKIKSFGDRHKLKLTCAVAWGLGYQGLTLFWITGIHPMTWMGVPWFWSLCIAAICWLIITFWGICIPFFWAVGMLIFQDLATVKPLGLAGRCNRVLFGTALWCIAEYFLSQSDLFWHFLAFSQSPHNLFLLQLTRFSGFTTVTTIIVATNALFAESIFSFLQQKRKFFITSSLIGFSLILLASSHVWGWYLFSNAELVTNRSAKIGIIQGNIPNEIKLYEDGTSRAIANYTKGYRELAKQNVDLIITPETALPFSIEQVLGGTEFSRAMRWERVPIILGAFGAEGKNFTNSLFTISAQTEVISRYNKQQLVPLGEYIPFESILGKFIDRLSPLDAHLVRGQNPPTLFTPIGQAIAAICYESAYPEHFRRQTAAGGEYIIVSSNDAHYSPTMPAQHHALDIMQAIANDRWTVRASNTGISGVIKPNGETIWKSQLNDTVTYATDIYLKQTKNPYVAFGNWLLPLYLIIIFLQIVYQYRR